MMRASNRYGQAGEWMTQSVQGFQPITIRVDGADVVHLSVRPSFNQHNSTTEEEFWAFLQSLGRDWLWEHVYMPFGIDALVDSIADGTAVLVTDDSYSRKICSDIDGAGWIIYCRACCKVVFKGSFYEWCGNAGLYRGELLGLLMVHLMVLAVEKFYKLPARLRGLVACDNLGGLNKSRERPKKIPPGLKHRDILRCLRRVHAALRGTLQYKHVYGHQDKHKKWEQMSLLERLNYKCDALAKSAVARGIINCTETVSTARQRLPLESVALFHNGVNGREIRFQIGKVEARKFYITQLGWYATAFDNVDWESRDRRQRSTWQARYVQNMVV
jgi:hypothetical protein